MNTSGGFNKLRALNYGIAKAGMENVNHEKVA